MTDAIAHRLRDNSVRAVAGQVAFVIIVGGLIAVSRKYFDLHIGVPGHTGILWMFLLVYGRGLMKRPGAGILMGASAALWLELLGVKQTLPYNLLLLVSVGSIVDVVAAAPRIPLSHPLGGLLAGASAHAGKYGFILVHAKVLALPKSFLLVGVMWSFALHLVFGALGGLVAGTVLWLAMRRSEPRNREGILPKT